MVGLFVAFKYHGFGGGIAGTRREFFIGSGLFVTNQTIDAGLIREIKILAFPTITGVAGCATSLVAFDVNSEIVDG
jgi:hypothetical protein